MIIKITKNDKYLGTIEFSAQNEPIFIGEHSQELSDFVKKSIADGITQIADSYEESAQSYTMIEVPANQTDENFSLIFKQFLDRNGYKTTVEHPEIISKIRELLKEYPDDDPDKIDILKRLPDMSYLEQTAILEELKAK